MWLNLISMQSSEGGGESGINKEEYVYKIAQGIEEKIPVEFDVLYLRKEAGNDISPSTVVLFQELERFNLLISKITLTIANLKRALNGEIGMNSELDNLSLSLFNGFLPDSWARLAPQTQKALGAWIVHFGKRFKLYQDWIIREPIVMWISGLHIP